MSPRSLSLASAAALLFLLTHANALEPSCPYGVNAHLASNDALDAARAAGIGWVRMDLNWYQVETSKGVFDFSETDRFIDHATDLGLNVFVTIAYTPSWAVGVPCNDADPNPVNRCLNAHPTNEADWTDFVGVVVARYQDRVKHYGMWNEPNLDQFYKGQRDEWVNGILVPGSASVHAACSDCFVLGPELANLRSAHWDADEGQCAFGECAFNGWNYSLEQILIAAADSIDIVTHHKYDDPATSLWDEATDGEFVGGFQIMNGVKELTDQHAPGKPVWLTETGWETPPFGDDPPDYAAAQLAALFQGFVGVVDGTQPGVANQPWPELQKVFWYDLHDDPNAASWGLLDASLAPKATYTAYADVIATLGIDCENPPTNSSSSSSTTTGSGGSGGGNSTSGAGGDPSAGGAPGAGPGSGPGAGGGGAGAGGDPAGDGADGCSCRLASTPGTAPSGAWLGLLIFVAARRAARTKKLASTPCASGILQ